MARRNDWPVAGISQDKWSPEGAECTVWRKQVQEDMECQSEDWFSFAGSVTKRERFRNIEFRMLVRNGYKKLIII